MKTAYATIKRLEIMRMFESEQFDIWLYGKRNEASFVKELFEVYG